MPTLTRIDGRYVPFASRALNSPALTKALAGGPLHARVRKLGRAILGHSTEISDHMRKGNKAIAKRRNLNKLAGNPTHNRRGHVWHNGHPSAMSSKRW